MWPGLCCIVAGFALGAFALDMGRSLRRQNVREDLVGAWMTGAENAPQPNLIYVVAGMFLVAQEFIKRTGEDPRVFKIVLHPEGLRGLGQGAKVIMILGEYRGRRMAEFDDRLAALSADVRYVDLDRMMGVPR